MEGALSEDESTVSEILKDLRRQREKASDRDAPIWRRVDVLLRDFASD